MKFNNHLIVLATIIFGFWLDYHLNQLTIKYFIELNFGFLIFSYWVFAMPEKIKSLAAALYGLANRFIFF